MQVNHCRNCHTTIDARATYCRSCHWRIVRTRRWRELATTVTPAPTLRAYPNQPAIIGATCQPDWQRAVAWESRPQRWTTLRPAERRSA